MNVFDFAMQMELDSKAYYDQLKTEIPVEELKKIFSILADNEIRHYDTLNAMKKGVPAEMTEYTALEEAHSVFQTIRIDETLLGGMRTKLDCFRHAMMIEEESIRLYADIAEKETKGGASENVAHLLKIIEEEKKHYNLVGKIHDLYVRYENFSDRQTPD